MHLPTRAHPCTELEAKIVELTKGQEAMRLLGLEKSNADLKKQNEHLHSKNEDLRDENHDLRGYIDRLLVQLLELDPAAIERAAVA